MKFPHSNSPLNINSFRGSLFISDEQIADFTFFAQKPVRPKFTYNSYLLPSVSRNGKKQDQISIT